MKKDLARAFSKKVNAKTSQIIILGLIAYYYSYNNINI